MMVTVSSKGQLVLPAELRRKYGIDAGSRLVVVDLAGSIHLVPVADDPLGELRGLLQGVEGFSSAELIAERRDESEREG
ncbi:MAG: AbrB/MazE/SpoVT family DNA-binding domain-containing protein [Actinomycetota bacterium]|nr:AbrB/MazE/SpoVT family DNA-binding domain-containing protein [Actinomycetota bacterium]